MRLAPHTARASRQRLPPSDTSDGFLRFPVDPAVAPRETRPLRSTPITGVSTLLRSSPPLSAASVLSASRWCSACAFSLGIAEQVPKFPTWAWMRFAPPIHRTPH